MSMKPKQKQNRQKQNTWSRRAWKQAVSWLLCVTMIAPNMTPIVSQAATALENMPRRVEFVRPEALQLQELGINLATGSDEKTVGSGETGAIADNSGQSTVTAAETATPSELREPEQFYDDSTDEPDGILVQFDEKRNIRTYEQGEGSYVTVVGGYSGLYRDSDGSISVVDNRLALPGGSSSATEDPDEEMEENSEDIMLFNDLGAEKIHSSLKATSSNAARSSVRGAKAVRVATGSNAYYNEAGNLDVRLPEKMDSKNGYSISNGEDTLEIIPLAGDYSRSMASGNAVRYSSVFDNIDVQYTVIGDMVKEDIILLEKQDKNVFSYQLKSGSLKFKKDGDAVIAYKDSYHRPVFALTAPVMIDADGRTSTDIRLTYNASTKTVRYTADEEWLNDPERSYPVRIDPAGAKLVDYTAFQMNMVTAGEGNGIKPEWRNRHFGPNINPMAGYSEEYGYCRTLVYIDTAWEALMDHEATKPDGTQDGPDLVNVEFVVNTMTHDAVDNTAFAAFIPQKSWDPETVTWDRMKKDGIDSNMTQAGEIQYSSGDGKEMVFDITDIYYKWLEDPNSRTGLMLQAYVEGGQNDYTPGDADKTKVSWAETFYNQNGGSSLGPCLRVQWEGKLNNTNLETMDMSEFSVHVDAGVVETEAGGRNTKGILAHGASQAGSRIDYRLLTKSGRVADQGSVEARDVVECPDFQEVDGDCIGAKYLDSNWQSDPIMAFDPLELNKIYRIEAKGIGHEIIENEAGELEQGPGTVETEWESTDEFLLYLIQASDILPRIARYYGVNTNRLREDNQFGFQLAEAGDVIFIRNPGTKEPYTAPLDPGQMEEFIKNCLLNGIDPRCAVGGEPVNLSTGSFYMSQTDASFDDLGGPFAITRNYNGLTPYFRSEFGMGWNSTIGERVMVLADGSILFTREDGKGLVFTKEGEDTYKAPEGYDYELKPVDTIELVTGSGADSEAEEGGVSAIEADAGDTRSDAESADGTTGAGSLAAQQISLLAAGDAETPDAETPEAGTAGGDSTGEAGSGVDGIEAVKPSTGWEITEPDGTVRVFNAYGLLVTKKDRKELKTGYECLLLGKLQIQGFSSLQK